MVGRLVLGLLVVGLLAVAACGGVETPAGDELPGPPATSAPGADAPPVAEVAVCGPAPFLDQPAARPPTPLDEEILRWADEHPDAVAGVWWDGEAEQFVVVSVDPPASADAIAEALGVEVVAGPRGGTPVRVERAPRGATELAALQDRVSELAELGLTPSSSRRVWDATVEIGLAFLDEASVGAVRRVFADDLDAICVTGADPATAPPPGPQPSSGDGWRLLHDEAPAGESYAVDVAVDRSQYAALWTANGLTGEPEPVDFGEEIVIRFGATFSGSCPEIRLDDVVVDRDAGTVTAEIVQLGGNRDCTADDNPRSYVVAVDRDALPSVPFTVSVYPVCAWCRDVVVEELGDPAAPETPADAGLPGDDELPAVLAAAVVHRVLEDNSFGGGNPFDLVQVIERLGTVDAMGFLDAGDGRELTDAERDEITAALAPLPIEFVPTDVLAGTDAIDDAPVGRAVVTLGAPSELEGRVVITSQLWCGGLCGIGGANELVRGADGTWSIGEPVGAQWIS